MLLKAYVNTTFSGKTLKVFRTWNVYTVISYAGLFLKERSANDLRWHSNRDKRIQFSVDSEFIREGHTCKYRHRQSLCNKNGIDWLDMAYFPSESVYNMTITIIIIWAVQ
jgi:hypothetical protein